MCEKPDHGRVVVVAVDESDHSRNAFDWYMHNVFRSTDYIVVCHIPEIPNLPTFSFKRGLQLPVDEWEKIIEEQLDKVRHLQEEYENVLIGKKIHYKVKGQQQKNAGEGIIEVADSEHADLIVMGTRGLDAIRRTLLGSVSDYVVRHSVCPVIVCPKKKIPGQASVDSAEGQS